MRDDTGRADVDRDQPADLGALLNVLHLIRWIRELRVELAPLAVLPPRKGARITARQQGAIFDLLRCIDDLFPGPPTLWTEMAGCAATPPPQAPPKKAVVPKGDLLL